MGTVSSILCSSVVSPLKVANNAVIYTTDPKHPEFPQLLRRSSLFDDFHRKIRESEEISSVLNRCSNAKSRQFREPDPVREKHPVETEWIFVCKFLRNLLDIHVNKSGATAPSIAHNRGRLCNSTKVSAVDLLAFDKGGNFCPIEVKPFWELVAAMSASANVLCDSYSTDLMHQGSAKHKKWILSVSQVVGYMMTEQCVFGVLSTYNFFYVLHCSYGPDNNPNAVYITDRVECTDPEYLLKFAYVLLLAQQCTTTSPTDITVSDASLITGSGGGQALMIGALAHTVVAGSAKTSAGGRQHSDSFDSCTRLESNEVRALERVGEGRTGVVFKLPSREAAEEGAMDVVKLVDYKYPEAICRLQKEDYVYAAMKHLQDVLIPRIIDHVSCYGNAIGLRMNYIKSLDEDVSKWTKDDKERVIETLLKLARRGLFQNDLEARHFGYDEKQQLVMFDLEDVQLFEESKVTEAMVNCYIEKIKEMFN